MQKLYIKNFRQISEATLEIKDIMFIIGEQASGKSTIAKLIYFFKSLKQNYFDIITHSDSLDKVTEALIMAIQDKFAAYFGFTSRYAEDFELIYYFSEESDDYIKLSKAKSLLVVFSDHMWELLCKKTKSAIKKLSQHKQQKYPNFLLQDKATKNVMNRLAAIASDVFADKRDTLFIPAGRNITVSYPEQFQLLFYGSINSTMPSIPRVNSIDLELMKEFFSYSKFLGDYFVDREHVLSSPGVNGFVNKKVNDILHGHYKNVSGNERLFYDDKTYVPLSIASSGQQESIRIIQDLLYILNEKESTSRIIEEPETHLFPEAQAALIQLLVLVSNYTGTQFIITTHSPFIMTSFNNLLYLNKLLGNEDVKIEVKNHFGIANLKGPNESIGIRPESFGAYALKTTGDTYCKSIFDPDVNMIGENYIDEAAEHLYGDFDYMYSKI